MENQMGYGYGSRDYSEINAVMARMNNCLQAGDFQQADACCNYVLRLLPGYGPAYLGKLLAEFRLKEPNDLLHTESVYTGSDNFKYALYYADPGIKAFLQAAPYENYYLRAKQRMANAKNESELASAAEMFRQIAKYRDSEQLMQQCLETLESDKKNSLYEKAEALMAAADDEKSWQAAADAYACLDNYKDAVDKRNICIENRDICIEKAETLRKDKIYSEAANPQDCTNIQQLREALAQYESIREWKDAGQKADLCRNLISDMEKAAAAKQKRNFLIGAGILLAIALACGMIFVIIPLAKYNNASNLMRNGAYSEAAKLFTELNGFMDSNDKVRECELALSERSYQAAVTLMNNEKYGEAAAAFRSLAAYKDSADKAAEADQLLAEQKRQEDALYVVGGIIKFGQYEQDNNLDNGREPIEWMILDRQDDVLTLISRYALDVHSYHDDPEGADWESCGLRQWLNDIFYNDAFSLDEHQRIQLVTNHTQIPDAEPIVTEDHVYLLDADEAESYFASDKSRLAEATRYALNRGANVENDSASWWLRDNGFDLQNAAYVYTDGSIHHNGIYVYSSQDSVRPAVKITR